jgi:hypothetical protein
MAIVRAVPVVDVTIVVAVSFTPFVFNAVFVSVTMVAIMVIIAVMRVFVVAIMPVVIVILCESERG